MGFTSILFTYILSSIVIPAPRRIANNGMEIYKSFLFLSFFASISSGVNHEPISFTPLVSSSWLAYPNGFSPCSFASIVFTMFAFFNEPPFMIIGHLCQKRYGKSIK
jgi:hypothetical protein